MTKNEPKFSQSRYFMHMLGYMHQVRILVFDSCQSYLLIYNFAYFIYNNKK